MMGLMPEWARRMTGTYQPDLVRRLFFAPGDRNKAPFVRWAYPELPCRRMALARAGEAAPARASEVRHSPSAAESVLLSGLHGSS
jgi:hypothetical protein